MESQEYALSSGFRNGLYVYVTTHHSTQSLRRRNRFVSTRSEVSSEVGKWLSSRLCTGLYGVSEEGWVSLGNVRTSRSRLR